jgi:hypothetical protein
MLSTVPTVRDKQNKFIFRWHLESFCQNEPDPDPLSEETIPDPYQDVTRREQFFRHLPYCTVRVPGTSKGMKTSTIFIKNTRVPKLNAHVT